MLKFKLVLPVPGAADVVKRLLSVKVAEADPVNTEIADMAMLEVDGFQGEDNSVVQVSLQDVDDAGNASPVREQSFTLTDTLPPPIPGELGLVVTAED